MNSSRYLNTFSIKRTHLFQSFLIFFLISPDFINAELNSIMFFMFIIIFICLNRFKMPSLVLSLLWPMLLFICVGIAGSYGNNPYDILRDLWYSSKSLVAITAGILLFFSVNNFNAFLRCVFYAGIIAATIHMSNFMYDPSLIAGDPRNIRLTAGRGHFVVMFGLAILLASHKYKFDFFQKSNFVNSLLFGLLSFSFILSYSRTLFICLGIILVILFGLYEKITKIYFVVPVIIFILVLASTVNFKNLAGHEGSAGFAKKVFKTVNELKVKEYTNVKDINVFWRGYESYRAFETFTSGSVAEYIFGRGFGAAVDLNTSIQLGDEKYRFIQVLHNGYAYVLVKTGLVGLALYFVFLVKLFTLGVSAMKKGGKEEKLAGELLVSLCLVLVLTTLVISGFFNKSTLIPSLIILGGCSGFIFNQKHKV